MNPPGAAGRTGPSGAPWSLCCSKPSGPQLAVPTRLQVSWLQPLGGAHHLLLKGRSSPHSFCVSVCPLSARTYSNSSSSSSLCLSPATTSSHLLSSCCHRHSRVSQVRAQPSRHLLLPPACIPPPAHLRSVFLIASPGLLPTPNLFQLPQQTQGALLTSQPRAGLPTQVRLSTEFIKPLATS